MRTMSATARAIKLAVRTVSSIDFVLKMMATEERIGKLNPCGEVGNRSLERRFEATQKVVHHVLTHNILSKISA